MPTSLVAPRALTLQAPGQYSPGTSPTRASTPRPVSARTMSSASQLEAVVGFGDGALGGGGPGNCKRSLVKERRATAREANDRLEAQFAGGRDRSRKPWRRSVLLRKGQFPRRAVQAKGGAELARRDPAEQRFRDGRAVRGARWKALAHQPEQRMFANCERFLASVIAVTHERRFDRLPVPFTRSRPGSSVHTLPGSAKPPGQPPRCIRGEVRRPGASNGGNPCHAGSSLLWFRARSSSRRPPSPRLSAPRKSRFSTVLRIGSSRPSTSTR